MTSLHLGQRTFFPAFSSGTESFLLQSVLGQMNSIAIFC
jgi:hypothetical protein